MTSTTKLYHVTQIIFQMKSFEGCSWFKFNNLGLTRGKSYQHGNRVKAKSLKVLGASFRRTSAEKVVWYCWN